MEEQHPGPFLEFVKYLCTLRRSDKVALNEAVEDFLSQPDRKTRQYRCRFSEDVSAIFVTNSLTDAGINSNLGFFPELSQRIKNRILPPLNEANYLSRFISENFSGKEDHQLIEKLSPENWRTLSDIISTDGTTCQVLLSELDNALIILTHQLVSIGIDPYLVRKLPSADDMDSPFFSLNVLLNEYISQTKPIAVEQIFEYLSKCEEVFDYLKENRSSLGISLHLTFLIRRAEQHLARIRILLKIHSSEDATERMSLVKALVTTILRAELHSTGIGYFISENTSLLANRVANQTSSRGGDYIGFNRQENKRLFWSAMGGGFVVVFLVIIKHYIHTLHLPLLPEGILFGLNYGLGFVLMHFAHFTLATKQPAMTASYIAESIEQKGLSKDARKELSVILAQIMRSQFISLLGNLVVVVPVCYFSSFLFLKLGNFHVFDHKEATQYLYANHPLLSGSLLFAVFTGIFLALAGLITGYYDNKVVFSSIPQRIADHPVLKRRIQAARLQRIAGVISNNLGAVIGNLALGMFLGLAGNLGKFIGIPFDIRHITISAGNVSIALAQGYDYTLLFLGLVLSGVLLIGIINIISTFMISYLIACRSRYLSNRETWMVLASMLVYVFRANNRRGDDTGPAKQQS